MRTLPSSAKSLSTALGALVLLGSSVTFAATTGGEPVKEQPAAGAAAPVASQPVPPPPAPIANGSSAPTVAPAVAADAATQVPATPEPGSITEVGLQRLPGSAYPEPQTRGLQYGSLWLTFHGLQWPYMPATAPGSRFVVGVSGWGWVDTAYQRFHPWGGGAASEGSRIKYWKQQSRFLLRVTPTYAFDDGFFLQAQAEFVATGDQTASRTAVGAADTDNLWVRAGKWNTWDLQAGRFEGWEVFHLGMGLDQNTFERKGAVGQGSAETAFSIQFYGLTDNQFRPAGPAGNLAFHYYPFPFLRFEILTMAGSLSGPTYATRPVAIVNLGWLKLKGGVEYQKEVQFQDNKADLTSKGVGGAVQFVFEPHIEFGFNAAQGTIVSVDGVGRRDAKGSLTRTSFGGFANVSNGNPRHNFIFGVGSMFTRNVDQNDLLMNGVVDNYWLYQGFVAAQYVIHSTFYLKLVGGYSRGHWINSGSDPAITYSDEMYSARLRFSFYF